MTALIKTTAEYEVLMAEADQLTQLDPALGTRDGDRLELLAVLIGDYEDKNFNGAIYRRHRARKRAETLELFLVFGLGMFAAGIAFFLSGAL